MSEGRKRREYGSGGIQEIAAGKFRLRFDARAGPNGSRCQRVVTFQGTRRQALSELNRLQARAKEGLILGPARLTVGDYLGRWLADYAAVNVSGKTQERYAEIVNLHLVPALGHHPLSKLQPLHVQGYYSQALTNGRRDGKGGLAGRTVLHHHRILREALQHAVRWQLVARNVADAVEPPTAERKELPALDATATARILSEMRGTALYAPVLLALMTGMRRGEVLALRWQDVDLDAGVLSVRQSLQQVKGGRAGLSFKQPKTAKSRRAIDLPLLLVEALIRHKGEQAAQRLRMGPAYQDHGLVCCWEDGRPMVPNQVTQTFADAVRRLGIRARFHDLRHAYATLMLKQGTHPKVVSERLGHSTIGITLDTYSHVLPGIQREAAGRIDAAFRVALADGTV